ncbi:hypothetical protein [Neptunitalea lumnitzerae]|uniref:VCBS repeat-containing protein n=1 Tax=Neptunitalea lumnitzerae TaxID=2965509 RepID=A0ABQ5MH79_9FLAO|nr:hypothetical protein [Neptunitalea sp. Y10]GLB48769.1 hypothetical protein Y10_11370 [Neptunitalea sp. Y10]
MKYGLLHLILFFITYTNTYAQDTVNPLPTNPYESFYNDNFSHLKFEYNDSLNILNLSNNWDFDGDGISDNLKFIGKGGVHLYFYLEVQLSTNNTLFKFKDLDTDMPYLGDVSELKSVKEDDLFPSFVISDFNGDGISDIYFNTSLSSNPLPQKRNRLITFKNGKAMRKDFNSNSVSQ